MTTKKVVFLVILTFTQVLVFAQTRPPALWPVKNAAAGEHILGKPGDIIDGKNNYDGLFAGGMEGDTIVAPVDGIIESANYSFSFKIDPSSLSNMPAIKEGECSYYDSCLRNAWGGGNSGTAT